MHARLFAGIQLESESDRLGNPAAESVSSKHALAPNGFQRGSIAATACINLKLVN
jgi:hypothetical protein